MTMNINKDHEKKRADYFFKNKIKIHISKTDGRFHNGIITKVGSDFFFMQDIVKGNELMILYDELKKSIEKFQEVKNGSRIL